MIWELADMIVTHTNIRDMEGQPHEPLIEMINESMQTGKVTDKILDKYYHTKSEEDIAIIACELYNNEERIHPRKDGFKGGRYLLDFLYECFNAQDVSDEILDNYGLSPKRF